MDGPACETRATSRTAWVVLTIVVLLAAAIRVRLLELPLERDEGEFAYIGALLLDGTPPYVGAYTMKLPGTAAMYALSMAAFGRTITGIRIGVLLASTASTLLLFLLARRRIGSAGAVAAAAAFACISLSTSLLGLYGHASHFVVLAAVAGLLALTSVSPGRGTARMFAAGTCFGAAILMKQPGIVFAGFGLGWICWTWCRTRPRDPRTLASRLLAFSAGVATPCAAVAAALWAAGTLNEAWFWTAEWAGRYATKVPIPAAVGLLRKRLDAMAPQLWAFAVLGLSGLVALASPRGRRRDPLYFAGLLVFSFAGVSAGFYFRPHYFLLAAPAAALLVGVGVQELWTYLAGSSWRRAAPAVVGAIVVLAAAQCLWTQREVLFASTPIRVSRSLYYASPFPEAIEVARYLRAHTAPADTIAVLGSEPEIPFYAGRRSATGHIYMYGLMEPHPFARLMQAHMIEEIERARPRYVVYVRTESSWDRTVLSHRDVFDWLTRFLLEHHERVGQVDILGPYETRYRWDADVTGAAVTPTTHLVVFRRKDAGAAR